MTHIASRVVTRKHIGTAERYARRDVEGFFASRLADDKSIIHSGWPSPESRRSVDPRLGNEVENLVPPRKLTGGWLAAGLIFHADLMAETKAATQPYFISLQLNLWDAWEFIL